MTRSHRLTRTLAATLAIAALAAPAAVARPVDPHPRLYAVAPVNALGADVSAPDQQVPAVTGQDLRSPDRQVAAVTGQDLRSPDAADTSAPVKSSPVQAVDKDETPWLTIALALGACLALAGAAATAGRIRRRAGVAA